METSGLAVSMQSSISSRQLVKVWWEVQAELEQSGGYYSVSGTLRNDTYLEKNSFSGSFVGKDSDRCGTTTQGFIWKPEVNTSTFSGRVSSTQAILSIDGSMLDENTSRLISYVIQFRGKWDSRSAELSQDKPTPTWPKPGNPDAPVEQPQASSILVDTSPTTPTGSSEIAYGAGKRIDGPAKGVERKVGVGGIVGIAVALVFVLGLVIMAIFFIIQRRKRQQDEKVYPEIAYIYTPSPEPLVDSPEGLSKVLTHCNSNSEMRQVLVNDHSLPVTNQHQWREF